MISTGLILRKPGESQYAQFRRSLIANQVALQSPSKLRAFLKEQIADYSNNNFQFSHRTFSFQIFSKIESIQLDELGIKRNSYLDSDNSLALFRARKNCQKCSELIYHNRAFDLDWLSICPLHGEPLKKECRKCSKEWPSALGFFKNDCTACGVKVSISELNSRNAFNQTDDFQHLSRLSSLIERPKEHYRLKRWFGSYSAKLTNVSPLFMPSFSQDPALQLFRKELVNLPVLKSTSVQIPKKVMKPDDAQPKLSDKDSACIQSDNLLKSLKALKSLSARNHDVGDCLVSRQKTVCASCRSWFLICKITPGSSRIVPKYTSIIEDRYYIYSNLKSQLANVSKELIEISLPEPCAELYESDHSSTPLESCRGYLMSYEATKLVYEVDCWTLFVRIHLINLYLDTWHNHSKDKTYLSLLSHAPKMVLPNGLLRNPFHILSDENSVTIGVPSCLLDPLKIMDNPFAQRELKYIANSATAT
jgi:hypothetical protein